MNQRIIYGKFNINITYCVTTVLLKIYQASKITPIEGNGNARNNGKKNNVKLINKEM